MINNSIEESFKVITKPGRQLAELAKSFELGGIDSYIKSFKKMNDDIASLALIGGGLKTFVNEFTSPIDQLRSSWIYELQDRARAKSDEGKKPEIEVRLIRLEDGNLMWGFKFKKYRKRNSLHLLLLKALLTLSNDEGFVSYSAIDQYYLDNGKKNLYGFKKIRKRILDAKKDVFRLMGVPEEYKGRDLIEVVDGKGLKLYNPRIKS